MSIAIIGLDSRAWVAYCGYLSRRRWTASGGTSRGLQEGRPAIEPEPAEAGPVLVPVLDEDADLRTRPDVADAGEVPLVVDGFRLVVERGEQADMGRVGGINDEADRDGSRSAVGVDRREDGPTGGDQEGELAGVQQGGRHRRGQ